MPDSQELKSIAASVPAGPWAIGVSGGADSVALLMLLRPAPHLALHVVHLNHQTRGAQSNADADFVLDLARALELPCTIARISELETPAHQLPGNASARFRACRMLLFRRVIEQHQLSGVLLAHHADDQAETILQRLLRGAGIAGGAGLTGMSMRSDLRGLLILRPLLSVRGHHLREFLRQQGQSWREDPSNISAQYLRNRVRRLLGAQPELTDNLLALGQACAQLRDWARQTAHVLPRRFDVQALAALPAILARESARCWLIEQGAPPGQLTVRVLDRLLIMASDAASPPRAHFPGRLLVHRRGGMIWADR